MRIDYAVIGVSIVFLVGSIYLAGLSLQIADSPTKAQVATSAAYLFSSSVVLLVIMEIISLIKKAVLKPR